MIEAGTYMAAVAATGGKVRITNVIPKHLEIISAKLEEMGAVIEEADDSITISRSGALRRANIKTLPYPGFPTDMHPQMSAVLCCAKGTSIVSEGIWENRFRYVDELHKMGADISVDGRTATIFGVERAQRRPGSRGRFAGGAAMIIAALAAEGRTEISGIGSIERGYDDIVGKLKRLGANIKKIYCSDEGELLEAK